MQPKYKITTRRACGNPETYMAYVWTNGQPHCMGDDYDTRAEAKSAAAYYVVELTLRDVETARLKVEHELKKLMKEGI